MRPISLLLVIAFVATACGSDEASRSSASKETAAADATTETVPTQTAAPEHSLDERPPTSDEVAWFGRVSQWSYAVGVPVEVRSSTSPKAVS